jgi:tetratricopeptide (TPR) repeat protein
MAGRFKLTIFTLVTAGLALASAGAAQAQEANSNVGGRFRVLIPPFQPMQNADNGFGKDAAKKLRDLINTLATHQPVQEKEIKNSLKKFKLKMEDLDCIRTRQLASQMNAQVALCADYHAQDDNHEVVNATFYDVRSGESFKVNQGTFPKDKPDSAAQYIFNQFDTYVQQIRAAQFCNEYAASQDYQNAMTQCDKAIQLNPNAIGARYTRADILFQQNKYAEAMQELQKVLDQNPNHEDALQLAGYISAKQGNDEKARQYYQHYLDLNPSAAGVRMNIAYKLAQAGDPVGAMQLIQAGLDVDPNNTDLLEQYAGFAFNAAIEADSAQNGDNDSSGVTPKAAQYFQKAVDAGQKVFQAKGKDTPVGLLRNTILALDKLDQSDKAVQLAEQAIQTHGTEDQIWSAYADALHQSGQLDNAIAALDSVKKLNPSDQTASLKQGQWLIQAGRLEDAVDVLKTSAAMGQKQADQAAQMIFVDAYTNGVQKSRYDYAAKGLDAAKSLSNLSAAMQHQLTFWQAYSLYQGAISDQKPQTLKSAKATLPRFEQALELLKHVGDYPKSVKVDLKQLVDNLGTYVDIQKAIIKRGR